MGLFTNFEIEPKVYKSESDFYSASNNQKTYHLSYLHEILNQQNDLNYTLSDSINHINIALETSTSYQNNQLAHLLMKASKQDELANKFQEAFQKQELANQMIMERLTKLEQNNENLLRNLESEGLINQAILEQQTFHETALNDLTTKLEKYEKHSEELSVQLEKQEELFEKLDNKVQLQEVFHNTVMERLDQQEGLMKKISRELDHLRSVIYERSAHLLEQLETSINKITKPVQRFFIHHEHESKDSEKIEQ